MAYGHENTQRLGRDDKAFKDARETLKRMPGSDVCWRCGKKIDMNAKYNTPEEWTADHVQSLANGGDPTNLANLKPAHRGCNSKRGRVTQDLRLSRRW